MEHQIVGYLLGTLIVMGLLVADRAQAEPESSHVMELKEVQHAIEIAAASHGSETFHITTLAQRLQVPPSLIWKLRNQGRSWGELTTELVLAQQLVKSDPTAYPTVRKAIPRVEVLRMQGKSWDVVSDALDVSLDPVLHRMQHIQSTFDALLPTDVPLDQDRFPSRSTTQSDQLARLGYAGGMTQARFGVLPSPERAAHGIQ